MKPRSRGLDGPVRECCGRATRWGIQAGPSRTCEVPRNDPPTWFAAGPWECVIEESHRGPWIHTTTDPDPYRDVARVM